LVEIWGNIDGTVDFAPAKRDIPKKHLHFAA